MIRSTSNSRVKQIIRWQKRARARNEADVFITEGIRMAQEADPGQVLEVYISESWSKDHELPENLRSCQVEMVTDSVFEAMSDTRTPQGILCLVRQQHYTLEDMLQKEAPLIMLLEDLQDPGNVGSIFRTGEGAGCDGIILTRNSADIYNPKTIRSTMGSIFRMPFLYVDELEEILDLLRERGICSCAAHLEGRHTYDREDYRGGRAFLIGNEAKGLSEKISGKAELKVRIPMEGKLESLNAAVAAALLMYEAHRQRQSFAGEAGREV